MPELHDFIIEPDSELFIIKHRATGEALASHQSLQQAILDAVQLAKSGAALSITPTLSSNLHIPDNFMSNKEIAGIEQDTILAAFKGQIGTLLPWLWVAGQLSAYDTSCPITKTKLKNAYSTLYEAVKHLHSMTINEAEVPEIVKKMIKLVGENNAAATVH